MFRKLTVLGSAAFVGACSTAPLPEISTFGSANVTGSSYSVTTNGITDTITGAPTSSGNFIAWQGGGGANSLGATFRTTDVLAIGAMYKAAPHETFAGISGTLAAVPASGVWVFDASFGASVVEPSGLDTIANLYTSIVTINVDFGAGTLTGVHSGWQLVLNGDITGSEFTGTAAFTGLVNTTATTVPMQGGFYGTSTIAGIFAGEGLAGAFGGPLAP